MPQYLQVAVTVFGVVFLVELPDKTALATVVMATRWSASRVFIGVSLAFAVQSLVAVVAGTLLGAISPRLIHGVAGLIFIVVAAVLIWQTLIRKGPGETVPATEAVRAGSKRRRSPLVSAFLVVFASEWGDLSQLATAALQIQYQQPVVVFFAATAALSAVALIAVIVGNRLGALLPRTPLQIGAAVISAAIGVTLLVGALRG